MAQNRTRSDRRHARSAVTHKLKVTESKAVLLILLWLLAGDSLTPIPFDVDGPKPAPACDVPAEENHIIIPEVHQLLADPKSEL